MSPRTASRAHEASSQAGHRPPPFPAGEEDRETSYPKICQAPDFLRFSSSRPATVTRWSAPSVLSCTNTSRTRAVRPATKRFGRRTSSRACLARGTTASVVLPIRAFVRRARSEAARAEAPREKVSSADFDAALEHFIQVIQTHRYYDDDGSRKASVALFNLLGEEHPVTQKHRRTFNMALY